MKRQKIFDSIIERLQKPENSEKYQLVKPGNQLDWHIQRARESLSILSEATQEMNTLLSELDFDVSTREIMKILDAEGWK